MTEPGVPPDGFEAFERYSTIGDTAFYFVHEAFKYAHEAACSELAGMIFGERIMSIDPPAGLTLPPMPQGFEEWKAKFEELDVLDGDTLTALTNAWHSALAEAPASI